jgi:hypothetical protein
MADSETQQKKEPAAVELTAAQAAKAVKRQVPILDEKKKLTGKFKDVAVSEDEVLAWAKRGTRIVVVTTDGQKLEGRL